MVECSDASSGASLQPMLHAGQPYLPRSLTAAIIQVRFIGEVPAPSLAPQSSSPVQNRTHLDPQQRATPTQCDIHGALLGGFGGSGEGNRLTR